MKPLILLLFLISSISLEASQVVLITGASRGIGFAIADLLAAEGYTVYAGVRATSTLDLISRSHKRYPNRFHVVELDVVEQTTIDKAIEKIMAKEGRIDVLVNNAGIMIYGSLENHTIEEAQNLFDVNLFGVMRVTQAVLPIMRGQKSGRIIQISSRSAFRPLPSISVYTASKFALEGLSEAMAAVLKPWNIHVSLIEPGPVNTQMDFEAPYGTRLPRDKDPFHALFTQAGLLDPGSPIVQQPEEIAIIVKEAIEAKHPLFRYQTTSLIRHQAAMRLVDITGNASLREWDEILYSH
jgi:NADP-dependent 3-hydroxy acid dehydrogenase YdfG